MRSPALDLPDWNSVAGGPVKRQQPLGVIEMTVDDVASRRWNAGSTGAGIARVVRAGQRRDSNPADWKREQAAVTGYRYGKGMTGRLTMRQPRTR
jgi:hypothetical protein